MNIFQEIMQGTDEIKKEPIIKEEVKEQSEDGIIKESVEIKGELSVYNIDLESINDKVKEAKVIDDIIEEIVLIKGIEAAMDDAKLQFKKQVEESLKSFEAKKDALNNTISLIKAKAIKQAQITSVVKTKISKKVNKETGEVTHVKKHTTEYDLPAGMSYRAGSITYEYDEKLIKDDIYYKKTLKKTVAKKAVDDGVLSEDVRKPKRGDPSISIDRLKIGAYAKAKLEEKKDEENK